MPQYKTIAVDCEGAIQNEGLASGTIKPGMLLERTNAAADTVKAHAVSGGFNTRMFAVEDDLQGNTIDDDYAAGARVLFKKCKPGMTVLGLISNGENVAKSDKLTSDGAGAFRKAVESSSGGYEDEIQAVAREACDMSSSSGADDPRCLIEIL